MSSEIRVERIKSMRAAFFHSFSNSPEEDSWITAMSWINERNLFDNKSSIRVFGCNIYPTENPEPHGYGYYITINPEIKIDQNIIVKIIPGGLYAISYCEGFEGLTKTWPKLWKWIEESDYKYIGETRSEHGYELGLEEHVNWYEFLIESSQNQLIFNLMIQLIED